jgi:hypothetical protein
MFFDCNYIENASSANFLARKIDTLIQTIIDFFGTRSAESADSFALCNASLSVRHSPLNDDDSPFPEPVFSELLVLNLVLIRNVARIIHRSTIESPSSASWQRVSF